MLATVLFQTSPTSQATPDAATFLGWIIGFTIAAVILALVARPLLVAEPTGRKAKIRPSNEGDSLTDNLYERLAMEKRSLEELEYDHEVKAIADEDYEALKQKLSSRIIDLETDIQQREAVALELARERQKRLAAKREAKAGKGKDEVRTFSKGGKDEVLNSSSSVANSVKKVAVKEALKCSECATPFKPGDRFCANCNAPLPLICVSCGHELKDGDKFCSECGTPLTQT